MCLSLIAYYIASRGMSKTQHIDVSCSMYKVSAQWFSPEDELPY